MAKSNPETILLKGKAVVRKEGIVDGVVSPGHFVERGGAHDFQANATAGAIDSVNIVVENTPNGDDINTAYKDNDTIQVVAPYRGCEVLARVAANTAIAANAPLKLTATGTVEGGGVAADTIGIALEALAANATNRLVRMEVI